MFFVRKSYEKGSNMNLNEECLLNYLTNPDSINCLNTLLGEFCVNQTEIQGKEISFPQTLNA